VAQIQVVSSREIETISGEFLGLNVGPKSSLFLNSPQGTTRLIQKSAGASLTDVFAGIALRYSSVTEQFEAALEVVEWACKLIHQQGFNPYQDEIPLNRLGRKMRKHLRASLKAQQESVEHTRQNSVHYLVNGQYLVSTMVSTLRHAVRNMYEFDEFGTVQFAIVYNWASPGKNQQTHKKMFVGANSIGGQLSSSVSRRVSVNREEAHRLYAVKGKAFVPSKLTLDLVLAVMMAADPSFVPPAVLLDYAESITLGLFEGRTQTQLPSLELLAPELQAIERAPGTWGGHPAGVTLGSPRDEDTSVTSIELVLEKMAAVLPVKAGAERGFVKKSR